jgi:hypothetical protein
MQKQNNGVKPGIDTPVPKEHVLKDLESRFTQLIHSRHAHFSCIARTCPDSRSIPRVLLLGALETHLKETTPIKKELSI